MKKSLILFIAFSLISFTYLSNTSAQGGPNWRGSGGWGPGNPYSRMFNPSTVETVKGEVVSVDMMTPAKGMSNGIHLTLKTDKETISVHLGPAWYIEGQDVQIQPKDKIEVKGSRITFNGQPAIIAMEVKKGDSTLILRDANGFPAWRGWRRGM